MPVRAFAVLALCTCDNTKQVAQITWCYCFAGKSGRDPRAS